MSVAILTAALMASASPAPAAVPQEAAAPVQTVAEPSLRSRPIEVAMAEIDAGALAVAADDQNAPAAPVAGAPVTNAPAINAPVQAAAESPQPAPTTTSPNGPPATAGATAQDAGAGSGDIVVTGYNRTSPTDPLSDVNVAVFNIAQDVDAGLVEPVAMGYASAVPGPVRRGVSNALFNLREPIYAANFLLQHKIGKAIETLARFVLNSTLGILGLFDVAKKKPFHLPRRVNGLGNTLGFYGVPPGPYLYVPLVGPTTLRDLLGVTVDTFAVPVVYGPPINSPYFAAPATVVYQLEERVRAAPRIDRQREGTGDPYLNMRRDYLRQRQYEIDMLRCGRIDCNDPNSPSMTPGGVILQRPGAAPAIAPAQSVAPAQAQPPVASSEASAPPVVAPGSPDTPPPAPQN